MQETTRLDILPALNSTCQESYDTLFQLLLNVQLWDVRQIRLSQLFAVDMIVRLHWINFSFISTKLFDILSFHLRSSEMRGEPMAKAVRCESVG